MQKSKRKIEEKEMLSPDFADYKNGFTRHGGQAPSTKKESQRTQKKSFFYWSVTQPTPSVRRIESATSQPPSPRRAFGLQGGDFSVLN